MTRKKEFLEPELVKYEDKLDEVTMGNNMVGCTYTPTECNENAPQ